MRLSILKLLERKTFGTAQQLANKTRKTQNLKRAVTSLDDFPLSYSDFLPSQVWNRRDPLFEQLVYADMFERRIVIDIPEFYVGSIMAVTTSDPNLGNKRHRFIGICIRREKQGLQHTFTLRNVVEGLGVEIMYELYNPTILKIETLLLEKRLDEDLSYLIDALPEYSTFNFNMDPVTHPSGKPVPVNPLKVKLKPPPWTFQWFNYDVKGIEDPWSLATPWFKRKFLAVKDMFELKRFDIIRHYRDACQELEHDLDVQKQMFEFEGRPQAKKETRKLLRTVGKRPKEIYLIVSGKNKII